MSSYNSKVANRTKLARALKAKVERALAEGILEEHLDGLVTEGEAAHEADREQQIQLAEGLTLRAERAELLSSIFEREDKLRARLPAVIFSLNEAGNATDARFLTALSFARFRMRGIPVVDPNMAEDPAVKIIERVPREDRLTRLHGLANLSKTLLGREAIVAELARRGIDEVALTQLQTDAQGMWEAGKNLSSKVEATQREYNAVERQQSLWSANRRMIRRAIKGDHELESLYAMC